MNTNSQMLYKINKIFFGIYVIIITERGTERVPKKERKIKMVEVLEKVVTRRGITEVEYEGTAMMYNGEKDKKALIDAIDRNNFGGYAEITPIKDASDMYEYRVTIYID